MSTLEHPDTHHLSAVLGWLGLGNPGEAYADLQRIRPWARRHPDVLEAAWLVYSRLGNWDLALATAEDLVRAAPDRPTGWIHRAYSIRRVEGGGLDRAWKALHPALEAFPKEPVIPYNLACYAAQMDRLEEAWEWLHRAMESAGDVQSIKLMALDDPDLVSLRLRIENL